MEDKKRLFENKLSSLNTVLAVIVITLLGKNLPNRISPDTGEWYAFLRGESIYLTLSIVVVIPYIIFLLFAVFKKSLNRRILQSKAACFAQIFALVVLVGGIIILPKYYDAVYVNDDNSYTFVASRLFAESKSYTLNDVIQCHMEKTSNIWVEMSDGERVYISYGITTYSQDVKNDLSEGKFEYDIHKILADKNVLLTIGDREKIEREVEKYQARSDLKRWHEYLPAIVSNIP